MSEEVEANLIVTFLRDRTGNGSIIVQNEAVQNLRMTFSIVIKA